MAIPDPTTYAQRWSQGVSNGATRYVEGAMNTPLDPTALAIQAGPRYLQNVQNAFNSGKWANGLRRSGKTGWQAGIQSKGATNYATGANAAIDKVTTIATSLLSFESNLQRQIQAMPNITDADREARALAWIRGMRTYTKPA
jgi:hypothetical protein